MEWEVYYEDYLMFKTKSMNEDGTYRAAAIIDHDGKVWTQTSNFPQLTTEERITIMREFDEPGTLTTIGLYLGGTKYVVIAVEPGDAIRAHKWREVVTVKKTSAVLVIDIYYKTAAYNLCNVVVERVGNDLIKQDY